MRYSIVLLLFLAFVCSIGLNAYRAKLEREAAIQRTANQRFVAIPLISALIDSCSCLFSAFLSKRGCHQ